MTAWLRPHDVDARGYHGRKEVSVGWLPRSSVRRSVQQPIHNPGAFARPPNSKYLIRERRAVRSSSTRAAQNPDGLVRIVGTGRLTDEEIVECISSLRTDPKLEPDMNTLSDMRDIEVDFSTEGVVRMLTVMEGTADRRAAARAAIVVSSDVAFGMGRMVA